MGRKWEEGKEKEDFLEVSHTLLLHFMWSEPTCLGRPGHVGFIPETVCRNQSQDSVSKEERGMDTGSPLAGSAVELIKAHSWLGWTESMCLLYSPTSGCLGFVYWWGLGQLGSLLHAECRAGTMCPISHGKVKEPAQIHVQIT